MGRPYLLIIWQSSLYIYIYIYIHISSQILGATILVVNNSSCYLKMQLSSLVCIIFYQKEKLLCMFFCFIFNFSINLYFRCTINSIMRLVRLPSLIARSFLSTNNYCGLTRTISTAIPKFIKWVALCHKYLLFYQKNIKLGVVLQHLYRSEYPLSLLYYPDPILNTLNFNSLKHSYLLCIKTLPFSMDSFLSRTVPCIQQFNFSIIILISFDQVIFFHPDIL